MKSLTAAVRALCLDAALSLDLSKSKNKQTASKENARASFLIPIAKAFSTDIGCRVADIGIQVHGGMGYVEETGVAQVFRDVRVTAIYEGTNGIQAIDLIGRKLADNGKAANGLIDEIKIQRNNLLTPFFSLKKTIVGESVNSKINKISKYLIYLNVNIKIL